MRFHILRHIHPDQLIFRAEHYLLAGFHDAISACVAPSADGCEAAVHLALITLIRKSIFMGMNHFPVSEQE